MSVKNIIITVLIILLIIVVGAYIYLVYQNENFQKDRLDYIDKKEKELDEKEKQLMPSETCSIKLTEYNNSINKINSVVEDLITEIKNIKNNNVLQENIIIATENILPSEIK